MKIIPIYATAFYFSFTEVFDIHLDMNDPQNIIKFNVNQTGFYRVNYPDFVWQRIATNLETFGPSVVSSIYQRIS